MEARIRFTVDLEHCQRAADELCEILRAQERAFAARWNSMRSMTMTVKVARIVGIVFSLLGLLLVSSLLYFDTRSWSTQPSIWTIPLFVAFLALFIFIPRLAKPIQRWTAPRGDQRARRHADRALRQARKLVPYEADFDLKGALLIYTCGKDDKWQLRWARELGKFTAHGLAVQAENVTVIFNRPTSLLPAVVILQRDRDWTARVLREVGVTMA